ncbi:MAG: GTP-binding protein [Candidatus Aenigmarchaeota archaeon]|nr:GTP-binding protein [Candidatus Aenigmarchaeota archaeon]
MEKTPIAIISGYLGAGKTTLLKRIIQNLDRKFAILMNEFGEVSIDTQIIKGKNVDIQELSGGCVCCSLTGEFEFAIKEIIKKYSPEIIIVETTGVAEPDAIVFDVEENLKEVKLDTVIIVVDADSFVRFPSIGRVGEAQIEVADVVLLNKTDLVNQKQVKEVEDKIRSINQKAHIFKTQNCDIDIDLLFSLEIEHRTKKVHKKTEHTKMETFTLDSKKKFTKESLEEFLKNIPKEVYRLKGFVNLEGKSVLVNYVAGMWDLEEKQGDKKLVFIGDGINKIKDRVKLE